MAIKIALAGNPNCGKTTLFNALTGANQYVGNWPGVTVEKKEGKLKGQKEVTVVDLPGVYSLSPYTMEEVVARNFLVQERPDVILNIVDGTNLERNLYLTTQLCELGIPVVIAVNRMDLVHKNGDLLHLDRMKETLGCEVVEISALKQTGIMEAADRAVEVARVGKLHRRSDRFADDVEAAIQKIEVMLGKEIPQEQKRFYAIKLFERDRQVLEQLKNAPNVESIIGALERTHDDDSEAIVINERYNYVTSVIASFYRHKNPAKVTVSERIDRVVTNRFAALPIFGLVIFLVYFLSVTTVGTLFTDWMNDGVFGDGWYALGIGRSQYEEASEEYMAQQSRIESFLGAAEASGMAEVSAVSDALEKSFGGEAISTEERRTVENFVTNAKQAALTAERNITDENEVLVATELVTADVFASALTAKEPDPHEYGPYIPGIPVLLERGLDAIHCVDWLQDLILGGIVAGVGGVLGFVPQILVLFFLLAILESCGYLSRIAFILDRIFRRFGLTGKSFIPMLIGTGCGVPGVMASRTIENECDRRMTILTTTFMPCGAKMPIIALIAGAIFDGAWWVAPSAYFAGVAAIIVSGIILKKTKPFAGEPSPFVMELPSYHLPQASSVLRGTWERGWSFIKKAGTIILLATVLLWFLQSFGWSGGAFGFVSDSSQSILSYIGRSFAWLFAPLGWGDWRAAVATTTGLLAKENVVATLGQLYSDSNGSTLAQSFTGLSAYSFLLFNLLCAPCFAAIGAIKQEMRSAKWTVFAIGYQCVFAYGASLILYQLGTLFTGGGYDPIFTTAAILLVALALFLLIRPKSKGVVLQKRCGQNP